MNPTDLKKDNYVAVFSNTFWSIYNFRRSLIRNLLSAGYKVVAISADDDYKSMVESLGCETIVVKNLDAKSTSVLKELKLIREIRKIVSQLPGEYIYTFTIKPNLYTALTNVFGKKKTVMTVNGLGNVFAGGGMVRNISLQLFRMAFHKAHRVVFQNKDDFSFFQKHAGLTSEKVVFVRGSGINTTEFRLSERPPQEGAKLVFLLACRLLKEKGVYEYIEAARRVKAVHKDAQFWLNGMPANNQSAIDFDSLKSFQEQGLIQLVPQTDDVNGLLEKIDVLVLPSYYNEGVPRILLEGLSKGLPLITTDSVGCRETVINEQNGYLIAPRSVDELEKAMLKMIALPLNERLRMKAESRRLAETEFEESAVIKTYLNIIESKPAEMRLSGELRLKGNR